MMMVCRFVSASLAIVLVALNGCGGGGGGGGTVAGIGGTGKIASGTITGFGSIFVNGVEYDIDNASIEVNDNSTGLSQDDLRIGMVVTVTAVVEGSSGVASRVVYSNEIEGPVSGLSDPGNGLTKSFSVMGIDVIVDSADTAFDDDGEAPGFSFANIGNDDVVAISGFFDGSNALNASYIKKTDDFKLGSSEVELKGTADADPENGAAAGDSFTLDGVIVNIRADADLSKIPGERVTDAMFVEVKGTLSNDSPLTIDALRIEQKADGLEEDAGEVDLEGFVSGFEDNSRFKVDGQLVDASQAEFKPDGLVLRDGLKVEVEGTLAAGILNAREVKQED